MRRRRLFILKGLTRDGRRWLAFEPAYPPRVAGVWGRQAPAQSLLEGPQGRPAEPLATLLQIRSECPPASA